MYICEHLQNVFTVREHITYLPLLFKVHPVWSAESRISHNYLKAKIHFIPHIFTWIMNWIDAIASVPVTCAGASVK